MICLQSEYQLLNTFCFPLNWFDTTCRINSMGVRLRTRDRECPVLQNTLQKTTNQIGISLDKKTYMILEEELTALMINQKELQMNLLEALHFNKKINPWVKWRLGLPVPVDSNIMGTQGFLEKRTDSMIKVFQKKYFKVIAHGAYLAYYDK